MCLIITLLMFVLAIQNFIQGQWIAGTIQLIISLGFFALLLRNMIAVHDQKQGCSTRGCGIIDWFAALFKKGEK